MSISTDETPNSAVDPRALLAIKNAWKVLHVIGVSLAEAGRYWAVEGEEAGQKAILQIFDLPTSRAIFAAEDELQTALKLLRPELLEELEIESESLKYWDGPDSPNEAPALALVTPPPEPDAED